MFKSKTNLGLHILHTMHTTITDDVRITVDQIAEQTGKSTSFIEQTIAVLRANQLVQGHRGPGGGYTLESGDPRGYEYQTVSMIRFNQMFYPEDVGFEYLSNAIKKVSVELVIE